MALMADFPCVDLWTVTLDASWNWLPPTPAESERAARLLTDALRRRFLRSHAALRAILATYTDSPLDFAFAEHGKPYLPSVPDLRFNLSHSHEMALLAVAWGVDLGVDVEWLRPLPDCLSIAERFFPPVEAAALAETPPSEREAEFFRRWTVIEAILKGRGIGLYGAGSDAPGWSAQPVDVGPEYAAAAAVYGSGMRLRMHPFRPT